MRIIITETNGVIRKAMRKDSEKDHCVWLVNQKRRRLGIGPTKTSENLGRNQQRKGTWDRLEGQDRQIF